MSQKPESVYVMPPEENIYGINKHKEIYLQYPSCDRAGNSRPFLIKELVGLWLDDIRSILRPSSYARYQNYAYKYIFPYIGEMPVCNFDGNILSVTLGLIQSKEGKEVPLSQYTIYFLESMVRAMFHYGAEKKLIPEVLFGKAEYITVKKKEAVPLTELDMQKFLYMTEKQGEDMKLQILLPLYAGVTLSELCGLKWEDINTVTGEIHIHRNLVRIQNNTSQDSGDNVTATSMAECELPENMRRKFIMPEKLAGLLKEIESVKKPVAESYVAKTDKKAGRKRNAAISEDTPDGRTLQYRLKSVGEKAGIKGLTFKMLRDTFAVMCLQAGGDVYSLAYIMGASVPAVCDRYGQWMIKDDTFLKVIG